MDAVFTSDPENVGSRVAFTTKVTTPPAARVTGVFNEPEPDVAHEDPTVAEHVQTALRTDAGNVSVTVAATTVDGPELLTLIVQLTV